MDPSPATPVHLSHPHPISVPMTDVAMIDRHLLGVILLAAFAVLTSMIGLRHGPSLRDHEANFALAARNAIEEHRWLVPRVADEPWVRKTPLGIWSIAAVSRVLQPADEKPVSPFTARLPSALAAIINSLAVFWLGSMLFGHRAGLVGGFVAASCAATLYYSRSAQPDQLLTMFTTLAFAFFWRGTFHAQHSRLHLAAFYVCFAMAMMAKGPLPLMTIGLSIAVYWFVTLPLIEACERGSLPRSATRRWSEAMGRRLRSLRNLWVVPGIALFLVLAGAWPLYVYFKEPDAIEMWRVEYLGSYFGERNENRPFWYYIPIVLGLTFPFVAFIPEAVAGTFLSRYASLRRGLGYVLTWAAVTTLFLSAASFKQPHYLLSAIPAFCLLLAPILDRVFFGTLFASKKVVNTLCLALPLVIGGIWAAGTWYGHKQHPELERAIAFSLGAGAVLWVAASLAFNAGFRRSAFGLLLLSIPAILATSAPAVGRTLSTNRQAESLAIALDHHQISADAEIYWEDSRESAAVEFASGIRLKRLFGTPKLSGLGDGIEANSGDYQKELASRITKRIDDPVPAYFIMSRRNFDILAAATAIPHRVAFEVEGPGPGKSLVVFTQPRVLPTP